MESDFANLQTLIDNKSEIDTFHVLQLIAINHRSLKAKVQHPGD